MDKATGRSKKEAKDEKQKDQKIEEQVSRRKISSILM